MESKNIKGTNPAELTITIRELIVHLHRGNDVPAEAIVQVVSGQLKSILQSDLDPESFAMRRAEQTMFAIEEVQMLLGERDIRGALGAAIDAGKEWSNKPKPETPRV